MRSAGLVEIDAQGPQFPFRHRIPIADPAPVQRDHLPRPEPLGAVTGTRDQVEHEGKGGGQLGEDVPVAVRVIAQGK